MRAMPPTTPQARNQGVTRQKCSGRWGSNPHSQLRNVTQTSHTCGCGLDLRGSTWLGSDGVARSRTHSSCPINGCSGVGLGCQATG